MNDVLNAQVVRFLEGAPEYAFTSQTSSLIKGICPQCGAKSLFISKSKPFVLCCNHKNNCGFTESVRDAHPELFEDIALKHPPTQEAPNATADVYLAINRGFDLSKIRGWYDQGTYYKNGKSLATVRFYLDAHRTRYWERIIGGSGNNNNKAHFGGRKKEDGTLFKGDVWAPPGFTLEDGEECFLVEGILHAIALALVGIKAVAVFSCNHFPAAFFETHKAKRIQWVWALDGDRAGSEGNKKHHAALKKIGQLASVCLPPTGRDWDDLYRENAITEQNLDFYFYCGRLLLAETVTEKAYHIYMRHKRQSFQLDFKNALFSATLNSEFLEKVFLLENELRDSEIVTKAGKKAKAQEEEKDTAPIAPPTKKDAWSDYRTKALQTPEGRDLFYQHADIFQLANVLPRFLYMQRDDIIDSNHYVFSIDYANGQPQDIIALEGQSIATPSAFHQALLTRSRGGTFYGDVKAFKKLQGRWLNGKILTVSAFPYIGYEKNSGAYLFPQSAWHKGKTLQVNAQGYFAINHHGLKTSMQGLSFKTGGAFSPDWIHDFYTAFHWQGIAALSFFLGSLFVQQIRKEQQSFPFFELTGEAGAGKSTLLQFLWSCLGRDDYEGFDLLKSTKAGRRRAFSQVSNLPVCVIESDRTMGSGADAKQRQFDFDEMKPFFNGRGTGTLGVAKRGNDTDESFFQGALVIAQNAEVDGEEPLLSRIIHCHADKKHHTLETREKARFFERQTPETVGGFLSAALTREKAILEAYLSAFPVCEKKMEASGLRHLRIIKNHAQLLACAHCLPLLFPSLNHNFLRGIEAYLVTRAESREERLRADHPLVEAFWETYDYIASRADKPDCLNHAVDEGLIAINFSHFKEVAHSCNQGFFDLAVLKKLLPASRRYRFIEANRTLRSRIFNKSIKCWIFQKK